jgi:outer membrane murein-binding lipoprotein Lpp
MKKLIVLALSTGLLVWALGVGANSADAACSTKCLTKKIKKLQSQVGTLNTQVQSLNTQVQKLNTDNACIQRVSGTQYFGYNYTSPSGSFNTTALDFTESGDPIDAWLLAIPPGTCGTATSRIAGADRATGAFQPWQPAGSPQKKH